VKSLLFGSLSARNLFERGQELLRRFWRLGLTIQNRLDCFLTGKRRLIL